MTTTNETFNSNLKGPIEAAGLTCKDAGGGAWRIYDKQGACVFDVKLWNNRPFLNLDIIKGNITRTSFIIQGQGFDSFVKDIEDAIRRTSN